MEQSAGRLHELCSLSNHKEVCKSEAEWFSLSLFLITQTQSRFSINCSLAESSAILGLAFSIAAAVQTHSFPTFCVHKCEQRNRLHTLIAARTKTALFSLSVPGKFVLFPKWPSIHSFLIQNNSISTVHLALKSGA
jgi:hypothetical protein